MTDNVGTIHTKDMSWTQILLHARDAKDPRGTGKQWETWIEEASSYFSATTQHLLSLLYIEDLGEVAVAKVYSGDMNQLYPNDFNGNMRIDIVLVVDQAMVAVRKDTVNTNGHYKVIQRHTPYCLMASGFALLRCLNDEEVDPQVKDAFEERMRHLIQVDLFDE